MLGSGRRWRLLLSLAGALIVLGCRGDSAATARGDALVISTAGDADYLFPPLITSTTGAVIADQLFESLGDLGDSLNVIGDRGFLPRLADRWVWGADSLSIAFHLNPKALWHDGAHVRARDVRFTYQLYMNAALGSPQASSLSSIDSVTVRDSATAIFWFSSRSPEQFYVAAAHMLILPEHVYGRIAANALASSAVVRTPVGSGPFIFSRWIHGSTIEIIANAKHYAHPPLLKRVVWVISPEFQAAATRFLAGEADLFEAVRTDMLPTIARSPDLSVVELPSFKYGFLAFNLRDPNGQAFANPVFGSAAVRRALTMAVDRASLVSNVFDGSALPALGPMMRAMPTTDTTVAQIPFDTIAARRLLDSLGWRVGASGVRERAGRKLAFSILVPSSSRDRKAVALVLQAQFRRVNIDVSIHTVEINTMLQDLSAHRFDTALETWVMSPDPASVLQSWSSASARHEGSNYGGYANPVFDGEMATAMHAASLAAARPRYSRAYETIIRDAPAIWLFEPRNLIGVNRRVHHPRLRADAWWAKIYRWNVTRH